MPWMIAAAIGAACFATGLLAGLSLPQGPSDTTARQPEQTLAKTVTPVKNREPSAKPAAINPSPAWIKPADNAATKILQAIPAAENRRARNEWVEKLTPKEVPGLVAALCADVGPDGLDHEQKNLIRQAMRNWWEADSKGATNWLKSLPNGGIKRYLVSNLLRGLAYQDAAQAEALAQSFKEQDPAWDDSELHDYLVSQHAEKAWKNPNVTADAMLEIYSRFKRHGGWTRVAVYPQNFDFRKFLDGLASMREQDEGYQGTAPRDTLTEWAKIDPDSAVQWVLDAKSRGRHWTPIGDWRSIVDGIASANGPQAYHQWAAAIVTQPDGKLRDLVLEESESADLVGILQHIGTTAQRDQVLTSVLQKRIWRNDSINLLGMISTPEARLNLVASNPPPDWIERGKADPTFWPRVGLTTEQVDAAMQEVSKTQRPCPRCHRIHR